MPKILNKNIKIKNKNLNVKFPEEDYSQLQTIADAIGGMSLSSMIRVLVYKQLEKVNKSEDPHMFLNVIDDRKR